MTLLDIFFYCRDNIEFSFYDMLTLYFIGIIEFSFDKQLTFYCNFEISVNELLIFYAINIFQFSFYDMMPFYFIDSTEY